jgi:hypothetical protein
MLEPTLTSTQIIIVLAWLALFAGAWLLLTRERRSDNDPDPIVGVQRGGRTYYVRKELLDRASARSSPAGTDWLGRQDEPYRSCGRNLRHRLSVRTMLGITAVASLIAGAVLLGT